MKQVDNRWPNLAGAVIPSTNKRFLFLLCWVEGSDSASGDLTSVHSQDDLLPQFKDDNEHIFALYIEAPNEEIASAFGYKRAFFDNYTAHDTVSICDETDTDVAADIIVHI
jgi:hypothetical protein